MKNFHFKRQKLKCMETGERYRSGPDWLVENWLGCENAEQEFEMAPFMQILAFASNVQNGG